jgi:hypothetical protein
MKFCVLNTPVIAITPMFSAYILEALPPVMDRIGPMKAKLEPRQLGTLRPVMKTKRRVPTPEKKRVTRGPNPIRMGANTVHPNIAITCCIPIGISFTSGRLSSG